MNTTQSPETETRGGHSSPLDIQQIPCPQCGKPGGQQWRGIRALCEQCSIEPPEPKRSFWDRFIPGDYRVVDDSKVPDAVHGWQSGILGLYGGTGHGKSCAASSALRRLGLPFAWVYGERLKSTVTAASAGESEERDDALRRWNFWHRCTVLVLDDLTMAKPTEAFATRLCALLEARRNAALRTIWTANFGPGQLAGFFAHGVERNLADAIERRLCQAATLVEMD